MKRILSVFAAMLLLLSLSGCGKEAFPLIEDTVANALDWGNSYAAEQGDWIAMKSQGKEGQGILLYNKKEQKSRPVITGDYKNIGFSNNKVFYCTADEQSNLYYFDLQAGESVLLASAVTCYQVRGGTVYFKTKSDDLLHTYRLETGALGTLSLSYQADVFWWTDYGLYYFDRAVQYLMVFPNNAKMDRFVLPVHGEICDLAAIDGAKIAYIQADADGEKTLCTFNPADRQMKKHYQTTADHFVYVRDRAVLAEGESLCSVDLETDQVYSWGSLEGATDVQLLSDCSVSYRDGLPAIDYYAKSK